MAHMRCMLDKQVYMHARACTQPRSRVHTRIRIQRHKYVILIAFPLQLWLRERASLLHYTYIACIVVIKNVKVLCTFLYYYNDIPKNG